MCYLTIKKYTKLSKSYWDLTLLPAHYDAAIIGGGIVGLTTALHLKKLRPHFKIAVLERGIIPGGASTKNAGFACFGSLSEIVDDLNTLSRGEVEQLIIDRWEGLKNLLSVVSGRDIGFENNGGYELFANGDESLFDSCMELLPEVNQMLLKTFGKPVFTLRHDLISEFGFGQTQHLIHNAFEGQIHTGKMMQTLIDLCREAGIHLLFGTAVNGWQENDSAVKIGLSNGPEISAERLVIATNGFARELLPNLEVRATRAQVLITAPIEGLRIKGTFHVDRGYTYFRNIDGRILLGGARQLDIENEYTASQSTSELIQQALEDILRQQIIPNQPVAIESRWAGTMGTGPNKKPIVQHHSERVVVAVRMGGMGIAIGSKIGQKAAALALTYNGKK